MASLLLPLPRTTTTTICSLSSLLVAAFIQHLASHPPSAPLLELLCLYQVHSLQLSPTNRVSLSSLGQATRKFWHTSFYARIWLLARNCIATASTPHQRCQHLIQDAILLAHTIQNRLATLLITVRGHLLMTSTLLRGQLLTRQPLEISVLPDT